MKTKIGCKTCKEGTIVLLNADEKPFTCPYCKGTGQREIDVPDPSHDMSEWRTEVRSPCETPRFYGVRECKKCGEEEMEHPAGHFFNRLLEKCDYE